MQEELQKLDRLEEKARLGGGADKLVQQYTASIPFDRRLYQYDIAGSMAHAKCWPSRTSSRTKMPS